MQCMTAECTCIYTYYLVKMAYHTVKLKISSYVFYRQMNVITVHVDLTLVIWRA